MQILDLIAVFLHVAGEYAAQRVLIAGSLLGYREPAIPGDHAQRPGVCKDGGDGPCLPGRVQQGACSVRAVRRDIRICFFLRLRLRHDFRGRRQAEAFGQFCELQSPEDPVQGVVVRRPHTVVLRIEVDRRVAPDRGQVV